MTMFTEVNGVAGALDFHMQRQNLLAGNIANVDTPGYGPKELLRSDDSFRTEFDLRMQRTDDAHYRTDGMTELDEYRVEEQRDHIPGNDLNNVSLDREMAKLSANTLRYQAVTKMVVKQLGILSYATNSKF